MKKILIALVAFSMFVPVMAGAVEGDGPAQGIWTVREGYDYKSITAADNPVVKARPGLLAGIVVVGGTLGTLTVYDGVTCAGTVIVPTTATLVAGQIIPLGVVARTGICVTLSAATNLTVVYK
mgnify:CR=1 FL=1